MSFTGDFTAGGSSGDTKPYFCHQCSRTVSITISSTTDPLCPICNEGFLEEFENPNPSFHPHRTVFADPFSSLFPLLFPVPSAAAPSNAAPAAFDLHDLFQNLPSSNHPHLEPDMFDPFAFLRNHLDNLRSSGAQIQFVIENHPAEHGFRVGNLGDYFIGPGLEQLIQQLAENDPNRYGTPPAARSAIEKLPSITISGDMLNSEMNQCAVCKDEFKEGAEAKQMPCRHIYHPDCIIPWLELHNSCPVCRYELPTDDPDYETRNNRGEGSQGGGATAAAADAGGAPSAVREGTPVERSFRISLPWPFEFSGSSREGGSSSGTDQEDSGEDARAGRR